MVEQFRYNHYIIMASTLQWLHLEEPHVHEKLLYMSQLVLHSLYIFIDHKLLLLVITLPHIYVHCVCGDHLQRFRVILKRIRQNGYQKVPFGVYIHNQILFFLLGQRKIV